MTHKLKRSTVISGLYLLAVAIFTVSIFLLEEAISKPVIKNESDFIYVTSLLNNEVAVVMTDEKLAKPYIDEKVSKIKGYYDYQGEKEQQEASLIYYEKTYLQNSGVDYSGTAGFDVVAIADGEVVNVMDDELLGKVVEVRHNNELISIYQCLSETYFEKNQSVTKGTVIGKSGNCKIDTELQDHLHFEILHRGKVVNPEEYFDKTIKEL